MESAMTSCVIISKIFIHSSVALPYASGALLGIPYI